MRIQTQTLSLALLFTLTGCTVPGNSTSSTTTTTAPTNSIANLTPYPDPTGDVATYTTAGLLDESTPFFQPLGTNGRTCLSCHAPSQGMSVNTAALQALFTSTSGTDPVFDAVDGANCPTATTGNSAQHSLLLNNGLFRIAVTLPATAQFKLTVLSDPYGCAVTTTNGLQTVSVYRRPLASTNLNNLSAVMWDTRETIDPLTLLATFPINLAADLSAQATDAVATHMQGATVPSTTQLSEILSLEQSLYTAQITDTLAGSLSANGALGGPANIASFDYYPGINDAQGNDPTGAAFNPSSMTLYNAWANSTNAQQASINRGQKLFNTAAMTLENATGLTSPTGGTIPHASCSFCHDTPNLGNRSIPGTIDTGTAHSPAAETDANITAALSQLSVPSLPVYQITGCIVAGKPVTYTTSDPGRALFTGLCSDVNTTKVPTLRGLAARAPYFHAGSATTLAQVVAFYNARFQMALTPAQQTDLVNFLNAL